MVGNSFLGFVFDRVNMLVWYRLVVMMWIRILLVFGLFRLIFLIFSGWFGFQVMVVWVFMVVFVG